MTRKAPIVLFLLMIVTSVAWAGKGSKNKDGPGTKAVRGANDTISALLTKDVAAGSQDEKDLAAKVTASVRGFLDVDALGKRALSDQWDKMAEAQRTEF